MDFTLVVPVSLKTKRTVNTAARIAVNTVL